MTVMHVQVRNPKFTFGELVVTVGLTKKVDPDYAMAALVQHLQGKWGLVDAEDWDSNEQALRDGGSLFSIHPLPNEAGEFWIITDTERSTTAILLPSDADYEP